MDLIEINQLFQCTVTGIVFAAGTYSDLRYRIIRGKLIGGYLLSVMMGHLVLNGLSAVDMQSMLPIQALALDVIAGMLPGAGCLFLSFVTRESLGYGDSLLIFLCGMSLGLNACLSVLLTAFFGAGIWSLVQILVRRADRRSTLPFVPFLTMGLILYFWQIWRQAGV